MLDNTLIENALALTGTPVEEMTRWYRWEYEVEWHFCMAEFCYYLLSPEFIEKYKKMDDKSKNDWMHESYYWKRFGYAIYEYQSGNEKPLITLLQKIWN